MFKSTVLKLTAIMVVGFMFLSVIFSIAIFQTSASGVDKSLRKQGDLIERLPNRPGQPPRREVIDEIREIERENFESDLLLKLIFTNSGILGLSIIVSYLTAKKVMDPVEKAHLKQVQFASDASHELRTPLTAIKLETDLILRNKKPKLREAKEAIVSIGEEVVKMEELVEGLLALSKTGFKTKFQSIDLYETVYASLETFGKVSEKTGIPKQFVTSGNSFSVNMAKEHLNRVLSILIDNACKYGAETENISIEFEPEAERLSISNSVSGDIPDNFETMFDRFTRGESSRKQKGYGLGLSIARKILDEYSYSISGTATNGKVKLTINFS
jgi:two-component system sensor histidine kinase CiaH